MTQSNWSTAIISKSISDGILIHQDLLGSVEDLLLEITDLMLHAFDNGGRIFFLGNGGSAAEAQHIATEFIVRFKYQRRALPVIALSTDTSVMTATGNDLSFEDIFSRQIEALVDERDVVVALSTSGSSPNILNGLKLAKEKGAATVGFTGNRKGPIVNLVDHLLEVPSQDTQRIQEAHLLLWHIICELVDTAVANDRLSVN